MKNVDLAIASVTIPPPASDTPGPSRKKGAAKRLRSSRKPGVPEHGDSAPEGVVAQFAEIPAEPVDSPTWLLHAALWFQPDRGPALPAWTDLAIERHNRIPLPDFLDLELVAADRRGLVDGECEVLHPERQRQLPESDLAPTGWDARSIAPREEGR